MTDIRETCLRYGDFPLVDVIRYNRLDSLFAYIHTIQEVIMYQIDFSHPVHVFFCGIGGVSMSGLALILKSRGFTVSGSDRSASATTQNLEQAGVRVMIGQQAANITPDIDLVVFTSAIHPDNPEYVRTHELGIPSLTRAEVLGQIMKGFDTSVAISGTHGKTTTTSMISEILLAAGADPTLSIGGNLRSIGGNVRIGSSGCFVAEACEYTNSFLSLYPKISIILDIDADHLDFFKDLDDIRRSFRRFALLTPADGALIINRDISNVEEICGGIEGRVIFYGSTPDCEYYPEDITYDENACATYTLCRRVSSAQARSEGEEVERRRIRLGVPGVHNVSNSLAAIAATDLMGVDGDIAAEALSRFTGTDRRFEYKGTCRGFPIIDDYAHHPTEIEATLNAAAKLHHGKIFCIFQPHTYSRTYALMDDFAKALGLADVVILADIYAARETDTLGISSKTLQDKILALGHECHYFDSFEKIEQFVLENCRKDDVLITMGAGNVNEIGNHLMLQAKK